VCPLVYSGQKGSDSTFVAAIFRIEALGWCGMVGHAVAMATFLRVVSKKIGSADSDGGVLQALCVRWSTVVGKEVTALLRCHLQNSSTPVVYDGRACRGMPTFKRWCQIRNGSADSDRGVLQALCVRWSTVVRKEVPALSLLPSSEFNHAGGVGWLGMQWHILHLKRVSNDNWIR
jgi:hypothetical protein